MEERVSVENEETDSEASEPIEIAAVSAASDYPPAFIARLIGDNMDLEVRG